MGPGKCDEAYITHANSSMGPPVWLQDYYRAVSEFVEDWSHAGGPPPSRANDGPRAAPPGFRGPPANNGGAFATLKRDGLDKDWFFNAANICKQNWYNAKMNVPRAPSWLSLPLTSHGGSDVPSAHRKDIAHCHSIQSALQSIRSPLKPLVDCEPVRMGLPVCQAITIAAPISLRYQHIC